MCGITCIISPAHPRPQPHPPSPIDDPQNWPSLLNKSLDLLNHRGPDSRGHWISPDNRVALAHTRLSINDLSPPATQPLHHPSLPITTIVNGELYLSPHLSSLLSHIAYPFQTRSDSELVLALYAHCGLSFLSELRGEFALCLYDGRNGDVVVARDRYGIKPLFWTEMEVDPRSDQEMIEGVRARMLDAVRVRLRADVPVGIYLSGGIDSSVIAGMAAHLVKEEGLRMGSEDKTKCITCFSIAFDEDSGFDESAIANRTADHLGVKYYKKHMNETELAARFEDATWHCEHHNPDLNYVGKYALSEVPQELGFKVVLTGEGADEQFAGYPVYLPDYLREPDHAYERNPLPEDTRKTQCIKADAETEQYYESIGADGANRNASLARQLLNNITTVSSMAAFSPSSLFSHWTTEFDPSDPQLTIANAVDED
ncbi:hypothetical protein GRF29_103g1550207, partial [Pseudopithomyces chartarum]